MTRGIDDHPRQPEIEQGDAQPDDGEGGGQRARDHLGIEDLALGIDLLQRARIDEFADL